MANKTDNSSTPKRSLAGKIKDFSLFGIAYLKMMFEGALGPIKDLIAFGICFGGGAIAAVLTLVLVPVPFSLIVLTAVAMAASGFAYYQAAKSYDRDFPEQTKTFNSEKTYAILSRALDYYPDLVRTLIDTVISKFKKQNNTAQRKSSYSATLEDFTKSRPAPDHLTHKSKIAPPADIKMVAVNEQSAAKNSANPLPSKKNKP